MSLLIGLLLMAAQEGPVARETFSTRGRPVPVEREVIPALNDYDQCLADQMRKGLSVDIQASFQSHISNCAGAREAAMARADALLREAGWSDGRRRRASIAATFSAADEAHLAHASQLERAMSSRSGTSARRASGREALDDGGAGDASNFAPMALPTDAYSVPQDVFAETLHSFSQGREGRRELALSVLEHPDGGKLVLLTIGGLLDDSVAAEQQRAVLRHENGGWRVIELGRRWRCQPGRGPAGWTTRLCS